MPCCLSVFSLRQRRDLYIAYYFFSVGNIPDYSDLFGEISDDDDDDDNVDGDGKDITDNDVSADSGFSSDSDGEEDMENESSDSDSSDSSDSDSSDTDSSDTERGRLTIIGIRKVTISMQIDSWPVELNNVGLSHHAILYSQVPN